MKTFVSDFNKEYGEFPDDSVVIYDYPSDSNGFSFISHLVTINGDKDRSLHIITDFKNNLQKEFTIYDTIPEYNTQFPADNITFQNPSNIEISKLCDKHPNTTILLHTIPKDLRENPRQLEQIQQKLVNNNISIWILQNNVTKSNKSQSNLNIYKEIADIYLQFQIDITSSSEREYLVFMKDRVNKSQSLKQIDIQFKPYFSVATQERE